MASSTTASDMRPTVWFDIDNTLYSASTNISRIMGEKIHAYFVSLGLDEEEATELHHRYYSQYGLALAGLIKHHDVDPLDFDRKCDGALPLEDLIHPSDSLRKLFEDIDRSKVAVWGLTNANRPHAERVLRILGLTDQIEGLVFCDYSKRDLVAKPEPEFYRYALAQAHIEDPSTCYFVDDNRRNIEVAHQLGWGHCVHFCEEGLEHVEGGKVQEITMEGATDAKIPVISTLEQLRKVWPDIFQ